MTNEEAVYILNHLIQKIEASPNKTNILTKEKQALEIAIEALKERPQGEWIDKDYGIGKCWATCSECGESANGEAKDTGFGYDYSFPNFCPNCGACMEVST